MSNKANATQHTPGPWRVEPCSNGGLILVRGEYRNQILPCEDAILMHAAPDLLEALAELLKIYNIGIQGDEDDYYYVGNNARAAIAKATGNR